MPPWVTLTPGHRNNVPPRMELFTGIHSDTVKEVFLP
jgi:hypothetical protein